MESSYDNSQKEKESIMKGIFERLALPTEEFWEEKHPKNFKVGDCRDARISRQRLPLQYLYIRENYGVDGVVHNIYPHINRQFPELLPHWSYDARYRPPILSYSGRSEDSKDFLDDEKLTIIDNFSKIIEREWQEYQNSIRQKNPVEQKLEEALTSLIPTASKMTGKIAKKMS